MPKHNTCRCVRCDKEMYNICCDEEDNIQPMHGLSFVTYGHYGSKFFDPMNGDHIQIALCDECLSKLEMEHKICHNEINPH